MGIRLRKTFKIGAARINLSKSGIGGSIGAKGARITKMANGRTRKTISVPGTGISYVSESGKDHRSRKNNEINNPIKSNYKIYAKILKILGWIDLILGLILLCVTPVISVIVLAIGFISILKGRQCKKRYLEEVAAAQEDNQEDSEQ